MNIIIGFLIFLIIVDSLLLVLFVMLQRPRNEGLGAAFGAGVTDQLFGAQTTNVLQKITWYLGALFFGLTLLTGILVAKRQRGMTASTGLFEETIKKAEASKSAAPAIAPAPDVPAANPAALATPPVEGVTPPVPVAPGSPGAAPLAPVPMEVKPVPEPAAGTPTPAPVEQAPTNLAPIVPAPEPKPAESAPAPSAPAPAQP